MIIAGRSHMNKARHRHDICWPYSIALRELTARMCCSDKSSASNASLVQPVPDVHQSWSVCSGEAISIRKSAGDS
jgi:hypothetical protein